MFIISLTFSENRDQASTFMQGHNAWIKQGFDDKIFLLVGSIMPNKGGAIIAHNTSLAELESRVKADPFVAENVVTADVMEISPSKTGEHMAFLLEK